MRRIRNKTTPHVLVIDPTIQARQMDDSDEKGNNETSTPGDGSTNDVSMSSTALLEYENQIFLDCFHEDGLLIMARGLGLERIFTSFLKLYSDPGNLVLVLNVSQSEEDYYIEQLQASGTKPLPKVITNEYSVNDRKSVYLEGGVLFVTSRILVVDLLTERIPIHLISGILVYKAHKIIESCQEAFILRLFRQKNKTGFIKAFSSSPQSFTAGFCHVERVMKSLFVRKLFLWPRFQVNVLTTIDKHKIDVVELQVPLTDSMTACQSSLLDLIDGCIKELKRCNSSLDTEELTVENAITRNFEKIVKLHLDPVWHQLGAKTRQLVSDIKTLRLVLEYLTQYDCVNFYNLVNSIRTSERTFGSNSGWLFMDSADSLFMHAKDRIYGTDKQKQDEKKKKKCKDADKDPYLEECPKWSILEEVLEEIREENERMEGEGQGAGAVLVAANDDRTCNQIREVLCEGARPLLRRLYNKTVAMKQAAAGVKGLEQQGKGKGRGKGKFSGHKPGLTLTQMIDDDKEERDDKQQEENTNSVVTSKAAYTDIVISPPTILHPLHGASDPFSLVRTLQELQPRFVVLYDADVQFVRQLEVFRASRPGVPLRVYFLMYENSTEEQRYLTGLRKEKQAFEYLIHEKATMVIPEEREGKTGDAPNLARGKETDDTTVNTRKGGAAPKPVQTPKIIVDMREFRSELPSLIHRRGIDIEPVTIEVGDYILTPEICVERKSVSDLIGSLNNGRLYNQCVSMCRFYRRPVLLIEFDPNKPFSLQGKYQLSSEMSSSDVLSRLTLLTLHFPRLRILWCQSPYATAELMEDLKRGRDEPSAAEAMLAGAGDADTDLSRNKYNYGPMNMLLKMPGLNSKNVGILMNKVQDFAELVSLTQQQIQDILENEVSARLLYNFLHTKHERTEDAVMGAGRGLKRLPLDKVKAGGKKKR